MVGLYFSAKFGACVEGYDVHHITHKGAGGDDIPENLISLCRAHHNMVHNAKITKDELREILSSWYGYEYN